MPLVSLAAVRLGARVPADPRLDPIDLRECARTLTVTVAPLPAGPRPITEGGAVAFHSGKLPQAVHGLLFDPGGSSSPPSLGQDLSMSSSPCPVFGCGEPPQ